MTNGITIIESSLIRDLLIALSKNEVHSSMISLKHSENVVKRGKKLSDWLANVIKKKEKGPSTGAVTYRVGDVVCEIQIFATDGSIEYDPVKTHSEQRLKNSSEEITYLMKTFNHLPGYMMTKVTQSIDAKEIVIRFKKITDVLHTYPETAYTDVLIVIR